jgi:hypothetical protein
MKVELVVIDSVYAVRRTRGFWLFKKYDFLEFGSSPISWRERDFTWFKECLTDDLTKAKMALMIRGSNMGIPYDGDLITPTQFVEMNRMAATDEGMKDLLLKAKEFYLLKKKH